MNGLEWHPCEEEIRRLLSQPPFKGLCSHQGKYEWKRIDRHPCDEEIQRLLSQPPLMGLCVHR